MNAIKNNLLTRFYGARSELEKLLLLSSGFSIAMTGLRVLYTGELMFVWLNWNLFLAFLPYAITRFATHRPEWVEHHLRFGLLFIAWILLVPNSFYIITDLFHLRHRVPVPLWFDLALLLSFVWNGLLFGILTVRKMEKIVEVKFGWYEEWLFVFPVMLLNSFGVYIGRYLRYNSWDILFNPFQLFRDIIYLIVHPVRNRFDWSMIVCYAVFMALIYTSVKRLGKSLY